MTGALSAGDALPSMRVLARELRISVITTKRAYEELERDGFLENVPGKGCFVAPQNRELLREAQLRRVEDILTQAVEEARKGGFTLEELQELLNLLYQGDESCCIKVTNHEKLFGNQGSVQVLRELCPGPCESDHPRGDHHGSHWGERGGQDHHHQVYFEPDPPGQRSHHHSGKGQRGRRARRQAGGGSGAGRVLLPRLPASQGFEAHPDGTTNSMRTT